MPSSAGSASRPIVWLLAVALVVVGWPLTTKPVSAAAAVQPNSVAALGAPVLTGPLTILNWSFVRDDQPRSITCRQIAFAIRDEVVNLEKAGAAIIQIDEAALREGLPLRQAGNGKPISTGPSNASG